MASTRKKSELAKPSRPPATTIQARENQLISLAVDLAEKQMIDGSASSQVMTHFLKLATVREGLEREKLQRENQLLAARAKSLADAKDNELMYKNALNAMRAYSGQEVEEDVD